MPFFESSLRVLLVCASEKGAAALRSLLSEEGVFELLEAKSGGEARRLLTSSVFDLALISAPLPDEFGDSLACAICDESYGEALLLVRAELFDEVSSKVEDSGVLTVSRPVPRALFHQALRLAVAGCRRTQSLKRENRKLLSRIDELKLVERAKWALIEHCAMSEEDAHRYIEKTAMDLRLPKAEAARDILKKYS